MDNGIAVVDSNTFAILEFRGLSYTEKCGTGANDCCGVSKSKFALTAVSCLKLQTALGVLCASLAVLSWRFIRNKVTFLLTQMQSNYKNMVNEDKIQ